MPIYAYRCDVCGHDKDVLQKLSDAPLAVCPACGAAAFRKQVTAAGFQLKGSGWYVTDFKGGAAPAKKSEDTKTEPQPPAGESKPADDAKPAEATKAAGDSKPAADTKPADQTKSNTASGAPTRTAAAAAAPPAPASGRE